MTLALRVQPRASRERLFRGDDGSFRAALMAPPVEGEANKALCRLLAKRLGIAKSNVRLVSGEKSRTKKVHVDGVSQTDVDALFDI